MTPFEKWSLWGSSIVVGLTGIALGVMKYLMTTDDPYAVVHHPLQPWMLKLHILAAPVLVFAIGAVYTRHIVRNWKSGRREGRRTGIVTILVVLPMILSGYLIQTLTSESWLFRLAMAHIAVGIVYLVMFGAHQRSTEGGRQLPRVPRGSEPPPDPDA